MRHAAIALLLAATGCQPVVVPVKPEPFDVHVLPECLQACACDVTPSVVTTDPYSPLDAATREHDLRKLCVAQCEVRRRACADALERAHKAGVIR